MASEKTSSTTTQHTGIDQTTGQAARQSNAQRQSQSSRSGSNRRSTSQRGTRKGATTSLSSQKEQREGLEDQVQLAHNVLQKSRPGKNSVTVTEDFSIQINFTITYATGLGLRPKNLT